MIAFLRDLLYGDTWYIAWGIISSFAIFGLLVQVYPFLKNHKKK